MGIGEGKKMELWELTLSNGMILWCMCGLLYLLLHDTYLVFDVLHLKDLRIIPPHCRRSANTRLKISKSLPAGDVEQIMSLNWCLSQGEFTYKFDIGSESIRWNSRIINHNPSKKSSYEFVWVKFQEWSHRWMSRNSICRHQGLPAALQRPMRRFWVQGLWRWMVGYLRSFLGKVPKVS